MCGPKILRIEFQDMICNKTTMTAKFLALVVVFIANFRLCHGKRYDDYSMYKIYPEVAEQVKFLHGVEEKKYMDVIFLNLPIVQNFPVQVLVHANTNFSFFEKANFLSMRYTAVVDKVQDAFSRQLLKQGVDEKKWSTIPALHEVYEWLNKTHHLHPNNTFLEIIGKSYERHPIFAFSVKNPTKHDSLKIILEAGLHGNEWLGTVFSLYLIDELVNAQDDSILGKLREKFNWYFLPVMNPDGYSYSQKEDRLWKKNRRKIKGMCVGVDLNRNFDHKFGMYASSKNPTNMHYCGPEPFSEPETAALRDFLKRKRDLLVFYFSLHGSGQKFIIPYSDITKHVSNYLEMQDYAKQAATKIFNYSGRKYNVGNTYDCNGILVSGDSISWVKKNFYVPYVMSIMFRGDDDMGLALPNEEILPACTEVKEGIIGVIAASPKHLRGHKFSSSLIIKGYPQLIAISLMLVLLVYLLE